VFLVFDSAQASLLNLFDARKQRKTTGSRIDPPSKDQDGAEAEG